MMETLQTQHIFYLTRIYRHASQACQAASPGLSRWKGFNPGGNQKDGPINSHLIFPSHHRFSWDWYPNECYQVTAGHPNLALWPGARSVCWAFVIGSMSWQQSWTSWIRRDTYPLQPGHANADRSPPKWRIEVSKRLTFKSFEKPQLQAFGQTKRDSNQLIFYDMIFL